MINFPNSPVTGNTYDYLGVRYTYKDTGGGTGLWQIIQPGLYGIATTIEIDTGTNANKYLTPLGMDSSKYISTDDIASGAEINTGTNNTKYVTPLQMNSSKYFSTDDKSNNVMLDMIYPVGAIYMSTVNVSPGVVLGGTWSAIRTGRVLVSETGVSPYVAGTVGGSANAINVTHAHAGSTVSISDPGHFHGIPVAGVRSNQNPATINASVDVVNGTDYTSSKTTGISASVNVASSGSSGTNKNLQPYLAVYMWTRTA